MYDINISHDPGDIIHVSFQALDLFWQFSDVLHRGVQCVYSTLYNTDSALNMTDSFIMDYNISNIIISACNIVLQIVSDTVEG